MNWWTETLNKCVRRTKWSSHHSIVSLPLRAEPIKTLLPTPVKKGPYGPDSVRCGADSVRCALRRDHLGGLARQNWPHRSSKEWTLWDWLNPKHARLPGRIEATWTFERGSYEADLAGCACVRLALAGLPGRIKPMIR